MLPSLAEFALMVLVSSSMPVDYSNQLFIDARYANKQGLHTEFAINGADSQSQRWIVKIVTNASKHEGKDLVIKVDSRPFDALGVKKVPVFLLSYNGEYYRLDGESSLPQVLMEWAKKLQRPKLLQVFGERVYQ